MLPLGTEAPDFALPDPDGTVHRLEDFADAPGLLVMFICNHCPYVKHLQSRLAEVTADLVERGVAVVAIQPNDVEQYPDDRPERMAEEARAFGYPFPYLYDESQEVTRAYNAACTRTCSSSTPTGGSPIGASSTTRAPGTASRSQEQTWSPRRRLFSPARRRRRTSTRASGAASSGRPVASLARRLDPRTPPPGHATPGHPSGRVPPRAPSARATRAALRQWRWDVRGRRARRG